MSFILEALKKSEQERQQQAPEQRRVRRRTLSLPRQGGGRSRLPWLSAACLLAALAGGLWYFAASAPADTALQSPSTGAPAVSMARSAPPQLAASAPATPDPAPVERSAAQPATIAPVAPVAPVAATVPAAKEEAPAPKVEPAPVPVDAPPAVVRSRPEPPASPAARPAPAVAVVVADPVAAPSSAPAPVRPALYSDLSRELRARMPALDMSMHFYTETPARRLVRINNRLFREGDMVDADLQLVEITPDGALLDFLGMLFEMRGRER